MEEVKDFIKRDDVMTALKEIYATLLNGEAIVAYADGEMIRIASFTDEAKDGLVQLVMEAEKLAEGGE